MQVLVLNCGSSSIHFQLEAADPGSDETGRALARGIVSDAGGTAVVECFRPAGGRIQDPGPCFDHRKALEEARDTLRIITGGSAE